MLVPSCGDKVRLADIEYLPAPDAETRELFDRDGKPRPTIAPAAADSGAAYDEWEKDVDDWGKDRDLRLYRACVWINDFMSIKLPCGSKPDGIE